MRRAEISRLVRRMRQATDTEIKRMRLEVEAPAGAGNGKVGTWSAYRRVGATCPSTCSYLDRGCYAQSGRVGPVQRRSPAEADPSLVGVAACLEMARRQGTGPIRLHVSGDFARHGRIDRAYVRGVRALALAYGGSPDRIVAWSYTHVPDDGWIASLRSAGVAVRRSDVLAPDGAVVLDVAETDRPRFKALARERGAIPCPAQLGSTTCARCRACWTQPRPIAFAAHGQGQRRVREALRVLQ